MTGTRLQVQVQGPLRTPVLPGGRRTARHHSHPILFLRKVIGQCQGSINLALGTARGRRTPLAFYDGSSWNCCDLLPDMMCSISNYRSPKCDVRTRYIAAPKREIGKLHSNDSGVTPLEHWRVDLREHNLEVSNVPQ
ncbi:hypothetical protein VTK56DRAFT_7799 [Thermocarpiscus australiensis]